MSAYKDIYVVIESEKERPAQVGITYMGESCGTVAVSSLEGRKDLLFGQIRLPLVPWVDLDLYGAVTRVNTPSSIVVYTNADTDITVVHECDHGRQLLFLIESIEQSHVVGDGPRLGNFNKQYHPSTTTLRPGLHLSTIPLGFGVDKVFHNLVSGDHFEDVQVKETKIKTTNRSIVLSTSWNCSETQTVVIPPSFMIYENVPAKYDEIEIGEAPASIEASDVSSEAPNDFFPSETTNYEDDYMEYVPLPNRKRTSLKTRAKYFLRRAFRTAVNAVRGRK